MPPKDHTPEAAQEDARTLLAAVVDSSDDVIITKTLQGAITSWNSAATRLFGYTAAEAIGQPITMLIPQDRLQEEERIIESLRAGRRIDHYETVRVTKDGGLLDVALTISPIRNSTGEVIGASKILRDITERKRIDRALRDLLTERERLLESERTDTPGSSKSFLKTTIQGSVGIEPRDPGAENTVHTKKTTPDHQPAVAPGGETNSPITRWIRVEAFIP